MRWGDPLDAGPQRPLELEALRTVLLYDVRAVDRLVLAGDGDPRQ